MSLDARLISGSEPDVAQANSCCVGIYGADFGALGKVFPKHTLVHVHGLWTPFEFNAWRFSQRAGVRLAVSPHGMLESWALSHKSYKKKLAWYLYQRRMLESANLLVVNSDREYETMRRLRLTAPVAVIENGIDVSSFPEAERSRKRLKVVLFLSRLSPVKGIMDLLEAWARLGNAHGYELHIYGNADPGYDGKVLQAILRLGLSQSVKVLGPVFGPDKWRAFHSAEVFILPSYSENFGIVVAEAMLAGLPVITTRSTPWGALGELEMGWIVGNEPDELSTAISKAMAISPHQRDQMGERAAIYARQNFLWGNILNKYVHAYAWLTGAESVKPDFVYLN